MERPTAARLALADALAAELGVDMTPECLAATDKVIVRLWLHGYAVLPLLDDGTSPRR